MQFSKEQNFKKLLFLIESDFHRRYLIRNESGWLLLTMAAILPLALIALSFVVDLGRNFILKERLRHAVDGALVQTGRVYLERPELQDGIDNDTSTANNSPQLPYFPNGIRGDADETRKVLIDNLTRNLRLKGLASGGSVGILRSAGTTVLFEPQGDGTIDISINAQYQRKGLLTSFFALIPKGKKFGDFYVKANSKYKIAPKSKIFLGFLFDMSGSVEDEHVLALKEALKVAVDKLNEGDYITVRTFNGRWNSSAYNVLDPQKIVILESGEILGANEQTKESLKLMIDNLQRPGGDVHTYLQGGIFGIRKKISDFINANPNLESWIDYRKAIFILSDGHGNRRSSITHPSYIYSSPYSTQSGYALSDIPIYAPNPVQPDGSIYENPDNDCTTDPNVNPLTVYEADQARKSGILVISICDENCNDAGGALNKAVMKRLANALLSSSEINNLEWQINASDVCYIPYLTSSDAKKKDPGTFALPSQIKQEDLFSITGDEGLPAKFENIIGKLQVFGNELIDEDFWN
jgi:hypothetical protein